MAWEPKTAKDKFMFKPLDDKQEADFRAYCHDNDPEPHAWEAYHPVCRDEWTKMGKNPKIENALAGLRGE
jgi:hypothetical protein